MLSFNAIVSGATVAGEIANDDEEMAEMLKGLAEYEAAQFEGVQDYLSERECEVVAEFLRSLAAQLEA